MDETSSGVASEPVDHRADEMLAVGTVVAGRYTIGRHLAAGGMGRVYVAEQAPLGRKVALKVMHRELCRDQDSVKRFFREAVAVSQLTHPNTITVFDYGEADDGNFFIAMEFLEGEPLSDRITREGPLPPAETVSIAMQVARSLSEAHRKNIIHRDLKPENVFLGSVQKDLVKVLDFGIAKILQDENDGTKLTRMGFVCGTPEYMSPEQARGEELDGRSDIYALGVLVYEVLTGNPPFNESTPLATVLKHQNDAPPPLPASVPPDLADYILNKVMAKDPAQRPQTAEAFIEGLETAALHAGILLDSTGSLPAAEMRRAINAALASGEHTMPSDPNVTPPGFEAAQSGRGKGLAIGIVAFLLIIIGGGAAAWVLTQGGDGAKEKSASAAEAPAETTETSAPETSAATTSPQPPTPSGPKLTLKLTSVPTGAKVYEDDVELGRTPVEIPMESGGVRRTFVFRMDGYADAEEQVRVPEAGDTPMTVPVDVSLAALLNVPLRSNPEGALVFVNDEAAGTTPVEVSLTKELINVRFELEGYETHAVDVTPVDGEAVEVELEKKRRRSRRRRRRTTHTNTTHEATKEPTNQGGYKPFGD